MNTKIILTSWLLAMGGCASAAAPAQDPMSDAARMERMHDMAGSFDQTTDADARRALMRQHMELMREQMTEMAGMMDREPSGADAPDMTAMHERMGMMHRMMTEMMAQQDMMMRMQDMHEPPHADEDR